MRFILFRRNLSPHAGLFCPFSFEETCVNRAEKIFQCKGIQQRMVLVVNFFEILKLLFFCFVVAMSDLVHNVEIIHGLC